MITVNIKNISQYLLETIGDWLDFEGVKLEKTLSGFSISEKDNEELHIEMANAAMEVFCSKLKIQVQDQNFKDLEIISINQLFGLAFRYELSDLDKNEVEEMYHDNYDFENGLPKLMKDSNEENCWYWDVTSATDDIINFRRI